MIPLEMDILKPRYVMDDRFHREDKRLQTFGLWPLKYINPKVMAMIGFFYTGENDKAKCYFCEVEIYSWERTDSPVSEHMRWSKNCPLMRRYITNNEPINLKELDRLLPKLSFDVCGVYNSGTELRHCTFKTPYQRSGSNALQIREKRPKDSPFSTLPEEKTTDSLLPKFLIFMFTIFVFKGIHSILKK